MIVKVAPLGEKVTEVNVDAGSTVDAILKVAGVIVNGRSIRIDGEEADESTAVCDEGAVITLTQKMKGGR